MPLEGLRWSRDSGSALYDTPQTAVLGRALKRCCKMADVNFRKWTVYFVTHIHEYDNSKDVADFLPQRLKEKGIFRVQSLEFS